MSDRHLTGAIALLDRSPDDLRAALLPDLIEEGFRRGIIRCAFEEM